MRQAGMSDRDRKQRFQRGSQKGPDSGRDQGHGRDNGQSRPGRDQGRRSPRRGRDSGGSGGDGPAILYGWHPVTLALANPNRTIRKLWLTENAARRLAEENIDTRVTPELVRPDMIDRRLGPDAVHQGMLAEVDPLEAPDLSDLPQDGMVLVLDQITDPHNVGAILRSAAAFKVNAVITTNRHSPEATGVLAKSASGALELVPIIAVPNLARALNELNDQGFMTVGLDSEGGENISAVPLSAPLALVLGAEGQGLRRLTRETCSVVARLDMPGEIKSLNVSNAAVLALYIGASKLGLMS